MFSLLVPSYFASENCAFGFDQHDFFETRSSTLRFKNDISVMRVVFSFGLKIIYFLVQYFFFISIFFAFCLEY